MSLLNPRNRERVGLERRLTVKRGGHRAYVRATQRDLMSLPAGVRWWSVSVLADGGGNAGLMEIGPMTRAEALAAVTAHMEREYGGAVTPGERARRISAGRRQALERARIVALRGDDLALVECPRALYLRVAEMAGRFGIAPSALAVVAIEVVVKRMEADHEADRRSGVLVVREDGTVRVRPGGVGAKAGLADAA